MDPAVDLVSSLNLIGIDREGVERPFMVGVGKPYRRPNGEWACPTLSFDFPEARPIYGEDSLQALCLGLSFIRRRLEHFLEDGGRLLSADDRDHVPRQDLATWFSMVGGRRTD